MYLTTIIASTDRMIQLDIYITYIFTPVCLFCMHKRDSALGHKCQLSEGTFLHMVWELSKVRHLWFQMTEFIADKFCLPNVCNPLLYLLEVIGDEEMDATTKLFFRLLFFYVCKFKARRWINAECLTMGMWLKLVKADIPLYRMTYEAWGCPKKFRKVWFHWVDSTDTLEGKWIFEWLWGGIWRDNAPSGGWLRVQFHTHCWNLRI